MKHDKITDIANSLSNKDLVELLIHVSERLHITLPPSDRVTCTKVNWVYLSGSLIELSTQAWDDYCIKLDDSDNGEGEA